MRRIIEKNLLEWKNATPRKPLILRGARQVGKTYTVKQFGREHFAKTVTVDFERDKAAASLFEGSLSAEFLVRQLEAYTGELVGNGETLLFFDEIQAAPRALAALRYFYEEAPHIPIIAAGSALEFVLGDASFPVGRVTFEWLYPLSFYEFICAGGNEKLAAYLPVFNTPFEGVQALHQKIIEHLKNYMIVGGMPEAVKLFYESGTFTAAAQVHSELVESLVQSLVKYTARLDIASTSHVFQKLPRNVGMQLKYTTIDPERRIEKTKSSVLLLEQALLCHLIYATDPKIPLGAGISEKRFKPLFLDIGLMQHLCGIKPAEIALAADLNTIYQGALTEQFVGQELLSAGGSENRHLYYWSRADKKGNAEVDYLLSREGNIYPVEVKSGPAGRLRSLHQFMAENQQSPCGIALSPANFKIAKEGSIMFAPVYLRF